ncbi:ras-related protein Rab-1B-like [Drosophila innubila]|uniref:ras-related protein Rab-1B-like n=1 Tax=Drosophila innubila TaxID=198719 RepID=UPI00148C0B3F|nr:ras-related protein Rab-1B-like [Drosophila innubila]
MHERFIFKILMLGDAGVGKTCLLQRFTNKRYTGYYKCTIGIEMMVRDIEISGCKVKLEIWDTAGEERYRSMMSSYYRQVDGIVLVFDLTRRLSYCHVDYWIEEIKKYASSDVSIILVGNKCDAFGDRQVHQQLAVMYADNLNIPYVEASAVSGYNVDRLFSKVSVNVFDQRINHMQLLELESIPRGIHLRDEKTLATNKLTTRLGGFCC